MRSFFCILFFLGSVVGFAQNTSMCFSRLDSIESTGDPFLRSKAIRADSQNNYYITGGRMADISYYNGNLFVGNGDIFLLKFDQNHNLAWDRRGSLPNDNGYGQALAIDGSDNIVVGGIYREKLTFGNQVLDNSYGGVQNTFIAKFLPNGTHLWSKRIHTPNVYSSGQIVSLDCDAQGNIYFGGLFSGTLTFGQHTIQSQAYADNFWGKMDPNGNILWIRAAGSNLIEHGCNVATDALGNLYVFGEAYMGYVDNVNHNGLGFIAKYSTTGSLLWIKGAQTGEFSMGKRTNERKIDVANNEIVVTGSMFTENNAIKIAGVQVNINHDPDRGIAFVLKLDENGNGIWLNAIVKSTGNCGGVSIKTMPNGSIDLVGGTYNSTFCIIPDMGDTIQTTNDYVPNFYIGLNGQTGQVMDYCYPLQPGSGGYGVASLTNLGDTLLATGVFNHATNAQLNIFIAEIAPNMLKTGLTHHSQPQILVYPNPTTGLIHIKAPGKSSLSIEDLSLYDIYGKQVFSKAFLFIEKPEIAIDLSQLSAGIYFLKLRFGKGITTKKVIIE